MGPWRCVMLVTVGRCDPAHGRVIKQRARIARRQREPKMTATFTSTIRKAGLALALRRLDLRCHVDLGLCFQRRSAVDVHRRCVPPLQLGNPEYPEDHRLHDQQRSSLSSGCRAVMDRDLAAQVRQARRAVSGCSRFPESACGDETQALFRFPRLYLSAPVTRTGFHFARKRYRTPAIAFIRCEGK